MENQYQNHFRKKKKSDKFQLLGIFYTENVSSGYLHISTSMVPDTYMSKGWPSKYSRSPLSTGRYILRPSADA